MASINDGELLLYAEEATEAALTEGFKAGARVLRSSGVATWDIFLAVFNREGAAIDDRLLPDHEYRAALILDDANEAAAEAMGLEPWQVSFELAEVFFRVEREIDAGGTRHLNPDGGPHYELVAA